MRLRRPTVLCAALVAGVALSGCASSSPPKGNPAAATTKEFCASANLFSKATEFADGLKAAKELKDTGTPKGIPDDARAGFEVVVTLVTGSKDQADLVARYGKLTAEKKKSVNALDTYISKTC
jgi:outer membrane murein-binding lipoprotein Lpp